MASIVARNYADAIFAIAQKNSKIESFKSELNDAKEIFVSSKDLIKVLSHPDVLKEDKLAIIEKVFIKDKDIVSFIKILVENDRFSYLVEIVDEFEKLSNDALGIEIVEVVSAVKLTDNEVISIKEMLDKRLNKKVELKEVVDPSCLAGIRIILKDEILDNTIDTKIKNMKSMISKAVI